jgi:hypothetical protein
VLTGTLVILEDVEAYRYVARTDDRGQDRFGRWTRPRRWGT